MTTRAVLFDLGGTLVRYYDLPAFQGILREAIENAACWLEACGRPGIGKEDLEERARGENHESNDYSVRRLEDRLGRIFEFGPGEVAADLELETCRRFMQPIFSLAEVYPDSLPLLRLLRERGVRTAIVSNTPWGSPAELWREEIERLGILSEVDALFFCRDSGWRKPAAAMFEHVLGAMGLPAAECLFVGDDPRWDIEGPRRVGMPSVLIERAGVSGSPSAGTIFSLMQIPELL